MGSGIPCTLQVLNCQNVHVDQTEWLFIEEDVVTVYSLLVAVVIQADRLLKVEDSTPQMIFKGGFANSAVSVRRSCSHSCRRPDNQDMLSSIPGIFHHFPATR